LTEVPDHLLARSRARRAALGLGGGDEGGGEAAPAAASAGTEVEPAGATAAARPAAAAPVEVAPKAPEPLAPYVEAAVRRKRIPVWAMPVLAFFPVWGVLYAQSLTPPETSEVSQLDAGAEIYASKCASCHGGSGAGGVGRKLSEGEVLKTFPTIEQQLEFVKVGSDGFLGQPYGDPDRDGGAHIGGTFGSAKMPAFTDSLTDQELLEVVRHEREKLSGEKPETAALPDGEDGPRAHADGKPLLTEAGVLVNSDGSEMFDADGKLTKPAG
jgi:mono/diheme cytochrome c family protein